MLTKKRKMELTDMVNDLKRSLPQLRAVDNVYLEKCFKDKDYSSVVAYIKRHMGILFRISIKYYTDKVPPKNCLNGNTTVPAYVEIPESIPPYGKAQEKVLVVLTIYGKSMIIDSCSTFIAAMSHELSHLVLHGIHHKLKSSEVATDITAMILGYSSYYESGHTTIVSGSVFKISYLTFDEVIYVAQVIDGTLSKPMNEENLFKRVVIWIRNRIGVGT